jgi:hypothetical protein
MPWSTKPHPKPKQLASDDLSDFTNDFIAQVQEMFAKAKSSGWPLYRRGGSARQWTTAGLVNYTPQGFTQVGVAEWTGGSATSGNVSVTFPRKHSDSPLVWISVIDTDADNANANVVASGISSTGFTLRWWSASGVTAVRAAWLVMGPGAGE